ncbi:hypothetical protein JL721_7063 [Aureococcus anophagefferens]|nr:hypothetical protein JL721_7063 [Aureococcus anophagefferens]
MVVGHRPVVAVVVAALVGACALAVLGRGARRQAQASLRASAIGTNVPMSAKKVAMVELIAQFELAQDCFESMAYAYCAYSVCTVAEENPTHPTAEPTAAYCSCVIENGAPDIDLSVDTGLAQFLLDRSNTFVAVVEGVASGSLSVVAGANQGRTRVIQRRFNVSANQICSLTKDGGLFPELGADLVSWPVGPDPSTAAASQFVARAETLCAEVTMVTCIGAPCWVDSRVDSLNATCLCALLPKRRDVYIAPSYGFLDHVTSAVGGGGDQCDLFTGSSTCAVNGDSLMATWLAAPQLTAEDSNRLAAAALDSYDTLAVRGLERARAGGRPRCPTTTPPDDGDVDDGGRRLYDDLVDAGAAGLDDPRTTARPAWTTPRTTARPAWTTRASSTTARCLSPSCVEFTPSCVSAATASVAAPTTMGILRSDVSMPARAGSPSSAQEARSSAASCPA